jgi:geranylgeranyl pyrophosphate synthase
MISSLHGEQVRAALLSLPAISGWPDAASLFPASLADEPIRIDWLLPAVACRAVGADESIALPAVAAMACLQISIIVVDDILDQDPRGAHHRLGAGRAANLAQALQAAAIVVLGQGPAAPGARMAASVALAQGALSTAFGQELDVQNLQGEANYWRVVSAKSTPFYGAGLQVGALLGGADAATAKALYDVGVVFGEMVQIFDDLLDSMATPANPDWQEGRNNLAILYALTAEHARRDEIRSLLGHAGDPEVLSRAHEILVSSGAVSYCFYQLIERYRAASACIASLGLADPQPIVDLLAGEIEPLFVWLPPLTGLSRSELETLIK